MVATVVIVACAWSLWSDRPPVLLGWANLGFHELGHLIGYIASPPEWIVAAMGSGTEILVPLAAAAFLGVIRRDRWGAAAGLAWAATAVRSAAVYVADAPFERLELIGGEHDWAYVLGRRFDRLDLADDLSSLLRLGSLVSIAAAVVLAFGPLLRTGVPAVRHWVEAGSGPADG